MTNLKTPCLDCGELTHNPRCSEHTQHQPKPQPQHRGYDWEWAKLSRRARRIQPFCSDCGATEDLQADHTPKAWQRKAQGKPIRLQDIDVVCGDCNNKRGPARGPNTTRGEGVDTARPHPPREAKFVILRVSGSSEVLE